MSNGKREVEAINPVRVKPVQATRIGDVASRTVAGQPTAEELSRLTFAKLRDIRIHTQELHNRFARLLNRGSSLE
jgi:hypothetical protein